MRIFALFVLTTSFLLPGVAYALPTRGLDDVPLPTVRRYELRRDSKFDREFRKLPDALDWYSELLRRDVREGKLRFRLR